MFQSIDVIVTVGASVEGRTKDPTATSATSTATRTATATNASQMIRARVRGRACGVRAGDARPGPCGAEEGEEAILGESARSYVDWAREVTGIRARAAEGVPV
jgi:hypothetical protein